MSANLFHKNMESRIEALRSKAEEATSNITGDGQAKLMRQVETLQTQYSLAAENWRTIETSLNNRIAALEKERDEVVKREADVRKKARDVSSKSRRAEEELDRMVEEHQSLTQQISTQTTEMKALDKRCKAAEKALEEHKADLDRQRQTLESEFTERLEEEKRTLSSHPRPHRVTRPEPVTTAIRINDIRGWRRRRRKRLAHLSHARRRITRHEPAELCLFAVTTKRTQRHTADTIDPHDGRRQRRRVRLFQPTADHQRRYQRVDYANGSERAARRAHV